MHLKTHRHIVLIDWSQVIELARFMAELIVPYICPVLLKKIILYMLGIMPVVTVFKK
jgi:hypothetical protein